MAVIGAGMAGLSAAHYLSINGVDCRIYEATSQIGGRVTTEASGSIIMDRGFQVIIEDYPELRRLLPVDELSLNRFYPGVYFDLPGSPRTLLSDPRRSPGSARDSIRLLSKLASPPRLGTVFDYLKSDTRTVRALAELLPEVASDRLFAPFMRAVSLDPSLSADTGYAWFLLGRFLNGYASLPTDGMIQLPLYVERTLSNPVERNSKVARISTGKVDFESGDRIEPEWIIVAVDPSNLETLVGIPAIPTRSIGSAYFLSNQRPLGVPAVYLPPFASPIYTLATVSDVAPSYLRESKTAHLISASFDPTLDEATLKVAISDLLGGIALEFELIRFEIITGALPTRSLKTPVAGKRVLLAGDYLGRPSMNTALESGRLAAQTIIKNLSGVASGREVA